ncbi:MAG TPA: YtxH domain-containing protein [Thermodesulfobacteriota bacterium]|nr:YtxH domain-containing protein [Thermodesulfobacteriota bacterium]
MEKNINYFKGFNIGLGLFVGGAIGFLAGLMFAPKTGKELRSELREKGCQIYGDTKQAISEAQMKTKSVIDDAMHRVDEFKKEAEHRLSEARLRACKVFNCASGERAPLHPGDYAGETRGEA